MFLQYIVSFCYIQCFIFSSTNRIVFLTSHSCIHGIRFKYLGLIINMPHDVVVIYITWWISPSEILNYFPFSKTRWYPARAIIKEASKVLCQYPVKEGNAHAWLKSCQEINSDSICNIEFHIYIIYSQFLQKCRKNFCRIGLFKRG